MRKSIGVAESAATDGATKAYIDALIKTHGLYGNGADGNATISGDTTITSDLVNGIKNYANLTVNNGIVLTWLGGILFVNGTLTLTGTGKIKMDGGDGAAGGTGGTASSGPSGVHATAGLTNVGGTGGTNAGGAGGPTTNPSGGHAIAYGGAGGVGGSTVGAGGAAGLAMTASILTEAAQLKLPLYLVEGRIMSARNVFNLIGGGGRGGGGGAGNGAAQGGGGGAGGGYGVIFARHLAGAGPITAKGGNGGTPVVGNKGGGAGGGGGTIVIVTADSGVTAASPFALDVSGGTHGNGVGTGTNGADGSVGNIYILQAAA